MTMGLKTCYQVVWDAGVCKLGCNKWQKVHNLANWTSSGTNDWWMTPVNDKYFHVNDNRCISLLYCFYVCVLCFPVLFFRKLSCFLRCSRIPYSWIAASGSLIPGDPSSVTFGLRAWVLTRNRCGPRCSVCGWPIPNPIWLVTPYLERVGCPKVSESDMTPNP